MSEKRFDNRLWTIGIGTIVLLLLLYVLAIGPATELLIRGYIPPKAYEVAYVPLYNVVGATRTGRAMAWYLNLWLKSGSASWNPDTRNVVVVWH